MEVIVSHTGKAESGQKMCLAGPLKGMDGNPSPWPGESLPWLAMSPGKGCGQHPEHHVLLMVTSSREVCSDAASNSCCPKCRIPVPDCRKGCPKACLP